MEKEIFLVFTTVFLNFFGWLNSARVISGKIVELIAKEPQQKQIQNGEQVSSSCGLEQVDLVIWRPAFFS